MVLASQPPAWVTFTHAPTRVECRPVFLHPFIPSLTNVDGGLSLCQALCWALSSDAKQRNYSPHGAYVLEGERRKCIHTCV